MIIHLAVCFLLVFSILFQSSKGGGFQGVFGSSGEVIFSSPSGSSFLRKFTAGLAVTLAVTSLGLTIMTKNKMYRSVLETLPAQQAPAQQQQPAAAAPQAQAPAPTAPAAQPSQHKK
ncbi:MAG: preprotein translocase subunit SecG [Elusimicrobiota bacterium]